MGVYSGWISFLLKYDGEVFLDEVSSVWFFTKICWWSFSWKTKYLRHGRY